MSVLPVYKQSFFVSPERPDGLRLKMKYRRGLVYTDMTVGEPFEGYHRLVHGGMLFGILDVIMWYAIFMATRKICMTRKTDMDFLKPVACDTVYRAQGKLLRVEERDFWATAWIEDTNKERCAQVTALFREARGLDYAEFVGKLDFTGVSPEIREFFLSVGKKTKSHGF
jgi:acyl-coenzyme A thioesterase PaaI-like protein